MSAVKFTLAILAFVSLAACQPGRDLSSRPQRDERGDIVARAGRPTTGDADVSVDAMNTGRTLADYLRTVPGVVVTGHDLNAEVSIRGNTSFYASNSPLFVVDGIPVGNHFPDVARTINVNEVASVRVLKDATSLATWGSRGANGVILISLKRGSEQ